MPSQRPQVRVTFQDAPALREPARSDEAPESVQTVWSARPRLLLAAAGLVLLAIACGAAGVSHKFLFLDDQLITDNAVLRSFSGLRAIWGQPLHMPRLAPLSLSALLVEYRLFHDSALGYRVVNLLLHATNVLLLWTLLRRLDLPGAWLAAALFAVHPVVVDAVDWVSQQGMLLCGVFYLSGLIVYCRYCGLNPAPEEDADSDPNVRRVLRLPRRRTVLYELAVVLFASALLCHVAAVTWPIVVLIAIWWERGRLTRRELLALAPFAIVGAAWWALSSYFQWHHLGAHGADFPGVLQRLQLPGIVLWFSAISAVAPLRTSFAYARWDLSPTAIWLYLPTLAAIAALIACYRWREKFGRGPFAAAAMYIAMLLPFLGFFNFDWMRQAWVADHLQYLALPVVITTLVVLLAQRWKWHHVVLGGLVAIMFVLSIVRAADYRDQMRLWNAVLARNPRSVAAHNALGQLALDDPKGAVAAMQHFVAVLDIDPDNVAAHLNIGRTYSNLGEWNKAMGEYHKVLLLQPENIEARVGLAFALSNQGDHAAAMREYNAILQRDPRNADVHNNLGLLFAQRHDWEQAIASYRRAIDVNPRYILARVNLSHLLFEQGIAQNDAKLLEEAADQLVLVTQIDPTSFIGYFSIATEVRDWARLQESQGQVPQARASYAKAAEFYRAAVRLKPESSDAWRGLGYCLAKQARGQDKAKALEYLNEALGCFRRAQKLAPDDPQADLGVRLAETDRAAVLQLPPGARFAPPSTSGS
jgi:tetratricopeptide (TPR) repeat protein